MGVLWWIVFGFLAGVVAKLLTPGPDPKGCLVTIALGIAGALIGGFIATQMGYGDITGFDGRSFLIAVGGAILLLLGYRLVRGR